MVYYYSKSRIQQASRHIPFHFLGCKFDLKMICIVILIYREFCQLISKVITEKREWENRPNWKKGWSKFTHFGLKRYLALRERFEHILICVQLFICISMFKGLSIFYIAGPIGRQTGCLLTQGVNWQLFRFLGQKITAFM